MRDRATSLSTAPRPLPDPSSQWNNATMTYDTNIRSLTIPTVPNPLCSGLVGGQTTSRLAPGESKPARPPPTSRLSPHPPALLWPYPHVYISQTLLP